MHNIQLKTKVYTNSIVAHVRGQFGKDIDSGVVADTVKEILEDDKYLDAIASVAWSDDVEGCGKKGVCPWTPEQLLELAPYGIVPGPIETFLDGSWDLRRAIAHCIQVTMVDAIDGDSWEENRECGLPEVDYDLFQVTYGDSTEYQWLATDKDGNALRDLCQDCREKASVELDRQMPEEEQRKIVDLTMRQVKN